MAKNKKRRCAACGKLFARGKRESELRFFIRKYCGAACHRKSINDQFNYGKNDPTEGT